MRTLEDLRQRCRIDPDEGDDWLALDSHYASLTASKEDAA
jgi:hypothetical protein